MDGSGVLVTASSGSVDTSTTGAYILTYTKTDTAGNTSNTVARTINVVLGNPPVVTLNGSGSLTVAQGSSYTDS